MRWSPRSRWHYPAVAEVVVAGGGSSGGGSSIAPTRSLALEDPITATHTAGAISRAAEAEPRAGSVTLSYCFIQKLASLGVI